MLAAIVAALWGAPALAESVMIDDFSIDQAPVQDFIVDGTPVVSFLDAVRSLSTNLVAATGPVNNSVSVGFGLLEIDNGAGDDSEVRLAYDLSRSLVPTGATNVTFFYRIAQSDANLATVRFLLNGTPMAPLSTIPGNASDFELSFSPVVASIGAGDTIEVVLNGAPGWDLAIDHIGVRFDAPPVPEPDTLALMGAGVLLLAAVAGRRRGPAANA